MLMDQYSKRRLACWLVIAGCLAVTLFCLVYPVYVIRPFRHQGPRELAAALFVLRFRPAVVAVCAAVALVSAIVFWRAQRRILWRVLAAISVACVALFAGLCRMNIYELMFHPVGRPAFLPAARTNLDGDEKVIAVSINGAARAYPIRNLSYHHVVNDWVNGIPIVATY
jgi:Protein of unknown function (DUF3179)